MAAGPCVQYQRRRDGGRGGRTRGGRGGNTSGGGGRQRRTTRRALPENTAWGRPRPQQDACASVTETKTSSRGCRDGAAWRGLNGCKQGPAVQTPRQDKRHPPPTPQHTATSPCVRPTAALTGTACLPRPHPQRRPGSSHPPNTTNDAGHPSSQARQPAGQTASQPASQPCAPRHNRPQPTQAPASGTWTAPSAAAARRPPRRAAAACPWRGAP